MGDIDRRTVALRIGLRGATRLVRLLGPLRYGLSDPIAFAVQAASGERRRRTVRNFARLRPDVDAPTARSLARASFREYGRTILDFVWASGADDAEVLSRSVVLGMEHVRAAEPTGAVLALVHHGSWDMAAHIAGALGLPLTTVMAPIGSPRFTDLVVWARQRKMMEVHKAAGAARGLMSAVRRRRLVALLSDIPGAGPVTVVTYCGGPVVFSTVPAWLAQRTGVPLLPVDCVRGGPGQAEFVITVFPAVPTEGRSLAEVMQDVATVLERQVWATPEQWYPFAEVWKDGTAG